MPAPGVYAFSRLEPGQSRTDELVFGSETPDVIDGAALLVDGVATGYDVKATAASFRAQRELCA